MNDSIRSNYPVMLDAAQRIDDAAKNITEKHNFVSEASLDQAVPEPSPENTATDPDLLSHSFIDTQVKIASHVRGPYRNALQATDQFLQQINQKLADLANAVRESAEEYRADDEKGQEALDHILKQMDQWNPPGYR